ncbi:MAG: AmmeMemoRadiSam system protein A, partial [Candidatus Omnitrophica bacterium]|nr:AmmeMemoRadiSam system protein A [Candidatus Omnitrophota bacterium]
LARQTMTRYIIDKKIDKVEIDDPVLNEIMGVFVTLHKNHQLRGCIGNIVGRKPLYKGVIDMAIASSTQDPRFRPVTKDELDDIDMEISVLSPLKKISDPNDIILGKHGVLVKDLFRSGVYLPQVATDTGWGLEQFMNSLCSEKAGMEPDAWKKGKCEIFIYTAEVFGEKDLNL